MTDMAYTNVIDVDLQDEEVIKSETGGFLFTRRVTNAWKVIPPFAKDHATQRIIHRLNSLGSLFYFAVQVLGKKKFQKNPDSDKNLHFQMCRVVEKDGLKEVIEIPRDHFKSTVYTECYSLWRALPFSLEDEAYMRAFGYGDRYIQWMKYVHNQDIRILVISEVVKNASKLGIRLSETYANNALFRYLFPEILPDASCTQNLESFHQLRTAEGRKQGEGTFDFLGVGGALQSRHYDLVIQDDLVGKDAYESEVTMQKTIEYHQLLVGAFDSHIDNGGRDNDEIVVGNRWSYRDLNSYIRSNEQYFNFTRHSALGGCCSLHPFGVPIFPEAFSVEKLARYKKRLGIYLYSCQFENDPINPADVKFELKKLRWYEFITDPEAQLAEVVAIQKDGTKKVPRKVKIRHKVLEGQVEEDVRPINLKRYLIIDPNHSGNDGRCRHAITVTGVAENPRRVYLLDCWAKNCGTNELVETLFQTAFRWKINTIHMETIAAQKYLKYHMDYLINLRKNDDPRYAALTIEELKTPKTKNAKKMRIDGLGPIFDRGEFWLNTVGMDEFLEEFKTYPSGKLVDVLDTLAYGPQVWDFDTNTEDIEFEIIRRRELFKRNIERSTVY